MRGSTARAAASARFAIAMRCFGRQSRRLIREELEIARERAQFSGFRQARLRIFRRQRGEIDGRPHHLRNAFARKVGSIRSAHALADEHPQPRPARTRFLQRLQFAHAHIGGKLIALGDSAFGVGRARSQRLFERRPGRSPGSSSNVKRFPRQSCGRCEQSGCPRPPARSGLPCRRRRRLHRA